MSQFTPNYMGNDPMTPPPTAGLAIASMCCGIVSLVLICVWFLAAPVAVTAVAMGFVARSQARSGQAGGMGMAVTGIVCGIVTLSVYAVIILVIAGLAIAGTLK